MNRFDDLEKAVKELRYAGAPQLRERILGNMFEKLDETNNQSSAIDKPNFWRTVMKSKIAKLTAAAVVIGTIVIGINYWGASIDGAKVAWGNVASKIAAIDYVHFYELSGSEDGYMANSEGWYAHGRMFRRGDSGYTYYDDGERLQGFDLHKTLTVVQPSRFKGKTFMEMMSRDLIPSGFQQNAKKTPVAVGADFLIYEFDPPPEHADWVDHISFMVGRNSLLPVQMKVYQKPAPNNYQLLILDYDEPEKPLEFFIPPQQASEAPHGSGEVVLDGKEVVIDINGAPGIRQAIVRLLEKYDGPSDTLPISYRGRYELEGEPIYFLEASFIVDEGFRSNISDKIPLWLNKGQKCGVGSDNWPDGKYRNIRYTPVLKPTAKENVFLIEISCWLRTK